MFKLPPKETFLKEDGAYDHQRHLYIEAIKHCTQFRNAIDIGGHVGFFSSKMVKDFIHVYAFEPLFHEYLSENVNAPNITIYPLGLSDKKANFKFNVREHHTGMSKIDKNGKHTIKCDILDNYNFTEIDLIKIDTENHERFIIKGMNTFFENNSPVIIIEINDKFTRNEILSNLKAIGYELIMQDNADSLLKRN